MKKKYMLGVVIAGCLAVFAIQAQAAPPPPPFKTATTRREISPEKPLFFVFFQHCPPDGIKMSSREGLDAFLNLIPADLKKYFAIISDYYPGDWEYLNERGVYFLTWKGSAGDTDVVEELYRKYEYYLGPAHPEIGPGANLDTAFKLLPRNLALAKQYGGYLMWQFSGRARILPEWSANFPEGVKLMRESGGRMIMLNRNNGIVQTRENISELLGAWQSGVIGHWGFDTQTFQWGYESGLTRLFGEESIPRVNSMGILGAYPEALFGIEMLETAALGGTVFTWEHPAQIVYSPDYKTLANEFRFVIIPLMRKMINERLISTKEQVQAQTPVAILRKSAAGGRNAGRLFSGLYGYKYDDSAEWLPYSGRYLRLPFLLTGMATEADKARYKTVVDNSGPEEDLAVWPTQAEKVAWFNRQFDIVGKGNAWYVHINDRWYIANPWINHNINTDFELPLSSKAAAASISGLIEPHTLAIVREQAEGLRIHLNNYRCDKDVDFWPIYKDAYRFEGQKYMEYVAKHNANPPDKELRETVIHLNGIDGEPKIVSATSEPGFERPFKHSASWDSANNRWTLRVQHNGPVDLTIDMAGKKRVNSPGDLALHGMATASSYSNNRRIPDMAIDGNDRSTRWEAGATETIDLRPKTIDYKPQTGEWLLVELRENKTFNRIVMKEYLDRIADYRIEYKAPCRAGACATPPSGTPQAAALQREEWIEIARGNGIGASKAHEFAPVTAAKVRIVITKTKPDSYGQGMKPSLYSLEIYGTEPGLSAPHDANASDIYEAEEDAVLGNGTLRIVAANSNGMYTFNNGYIQLPVSDKPFARFLVNAAEAGAYRLSLRYTRAEWFGTGEGKLNIDVNGAFARTTSLPPTKSWRKSWSVRPEDVLLKQGLNLVEYRNDYGDFGTCLIDHLQVTRVPEVQVEMSGKPEPMPKVSLLAREGRRYEAEDAQFDGGAAKADKELVFSGSGYAVLGAKEGQSATISVRAEQDGYYQVGLRYALPGGSGATFSSQLKGKKAYHYDLPAWPSNNGQGTKLAVRPEGKWGLNILPYWLEKGVNKIVFRVEAGESGGVYLDALVVGPTEPGFTAPRSLEVTKALTIPLRGGQNRVLATLQLEGSTVRDLIWESRDPMVVTVDQAGYLRGLKPGAVDVTARLLGGGPIQASCRVTVDGQQVNIAPEATASASAGDAKKAIDGDWAKELGPDSNGNAFTTRNWLYGDISHDWTTTPANSIFKGKKPWIMLEWKEPRAVKRIVVYGPAFPYQEKAILTDSEGGSMTVGPIAPAGEAPLVIPFETIRKVKWIKLEITKVSKWLHAGNGVGEIEVYEK